MMHNYFEFIHKLVPPHSKVIDLGCGDGSLLEQLKKTREIIEYGLEINSNNIIKCLQKGVNVIQHDMNTGLTDFSRKDFDIAIMSHTLQIAQKPDQLIAEVLSISKKAIITIPNFGHWHCRLYLSLFGQMPVTKTLPDTWYNTPNIHMCTFRDFQKLCSDQHITIEKHFNLTDHYKQSFLTDHWPNLFSSSSIYLISK